MKKNTSWNRSIALIVNYLLILLIGGLDYLTGYRMGFSIFYLLPIMYIVWHLGFLSGITASVISTLVWFLADSAARQSPFNWLLIMWNAFIRMGFFVAMTVVLSKLKLSLEREKKMARTDSLTGILNNHAIIESLNDEINRSNRYNRPFTLMYLDCDNFKTINDTFGHEMGNKLLKEVASTMLSTMRTVDKIGRIGGDEYIILMTDSNEEKAKNAALRLQKELLNTMKVNNWDITFSIGVATFDNFMSTASDMISQADRLMYYAKKKGKQYIEYKTFSQGGRA